MVLRQITALYISGKIHGDYLEFYRGEIEVTIKDNSKNKYTVTF